MHNESLINEIEEHTGLVGLLPSLGRLSLKEFQLITTLIETGNKRVAAKRAGYSSDTFVSVLIRKPYIKKAYDDLLALKKAERLEVLEHVINSLVEDAFFDIGEAFDSQGQVKALEDMSEHTRQRITSYRQGRYGIEITFIDKLKAKEQLLSILGVGQGNQGLTVNINFGGSDTQNAENNEEKIVAGQFTLKGLDNPA